MVQRARLSDGIGGSVGDCSSPLNVFECSREGVDAVVDIAIADERAPAATVQKRGNEGGGRMRFVLKRNNGSAGADCRRDLGADDL